MHVLPCARSRADAPRRATPRRRHCPPEREAARLQGVEERHEGGEVGAVEVEQDFVGLAREHVGCSTRYGHTRGREWEWAWW